jgi:plasmid maintenance system antidote protein VapI
MTGIRQHHISEMENYKRAIGRKNAIKFAKALKTSHKVFL